MDKTREVYLPYYFIRQKIQTEESDRIEKVSSKYSLIHSH